LGEREVTAAGVRIRLSSWPQQQKALAALRLLGYQVAEDSRDGEHGAALVVTGKLQWKAGAPMASHGGQTDLGDGASELATEREAIRI
jgi:hypothetical protein